MQNKILKSFIFSLIILISIGCEDNESKGGDKDFMDNIFYPNVISSKDFSENSISFTKNEKILFLTRTKDWNNQSGHLSEIKKGKYTHTKPIKLLDSIYNGTISPSGDKIIFSVKEGDQKEEILILSKKNGNWGNVVSLSKKSQIYGGYFNWLNDDELYFYIPHNNGDIAHAKIKDNELILIEDVEKLNTDNSTEFSPFIDKEKNYIIFTRYLEGDKNQQGFFISFNLSREEGTNWSKPQKISFLPYGWNAMINKTEKLFLYSDGEDIIKTPLDEFNKKINDLKNTDCYQQ